MERSPQSLCWCPPNPGFAMVPEWPPLGPAAMDRAQRLCVWGVSSVLGLSHRVKSLAWSHGCRGGA